MSRNHSRSSKPAAPPGDPASTTGSPLSNPAVAKVEFTVPTEIVDLPSQGLLYPEGHPWSGVKQVEIKHMTAKEEDILSSQSYVMKGIVLDKFLQSILLNPVDPNSILLVDRTAILVAARITGYGDNYDTLITCSSCNTQNEVSFSTSEALRMKEPATEHIESGLHQILFEDSDVEVKIRSLTVGDQAFLDKTAKMRSQNNLPENPITMLLKSMIFSVNNNTDISVISSYVDSLSAKHSRIIRSSYKVVMPSIVMEHDFVCSRCGHSAGLEVPLDADFFWPRQ